MGDSVEFIKTYFPGAAPFAVATANRDARRIEVFFDRADLDETYAVVSEFQDKTLEPVAVFNGNRLHEMGKQVGAVVEIVRVYDEEAAAVRMRLSSIDIVRDQDGTASTVLRRGEGSMELPVFQGRAAFIEWLEGVSVYLSNDRAKYLAEAVQCRGIWTPVSPALESMGLIAATPETYFRSHFEYYRVRDDREFWSTNAWLEFSGDYDRRFALLKILVDRAPMDDGYLKWLGSWGEDLMSERFLEDVDADRGNRQKWAVVIAESICSGQSVEIQRAAVRWLETS